MIFSKMDKNLVWQPSVRKVTLGLWRFTMKRTKPKKGWDQDPGWIEITWDEALDEIAGELKTLKDQNKAHQLAWISEDHSFTHIQADFCQLFGTPNYYMHSSMCDVGRKAGGKWTVGDERPLNGFICLV